jgi:hypothetical protein
MHHDTQHNKPVSLENEFAVLQAVISVCNKALRQLPSSNDEDKELLQGTDLSVNARAALQMRIAERTILEDQVRLIAKYWDTVFLTGTIDGLSIDTLARAAQGVKTPM